MDAPPSASRVETVIRRLLSQLSSAVCSLSSYQSGDPSLERVPSYTYGRSQETVTIAAA